MACLLLLMSDYSRNNEGGTLEEQLQEPLEHIDSTV